MKTKVFKQMKKQIAVFASVLCAMVCVSACSNELEVAETPTADEDLAVKKQEAIAAEDYDLAKKIKAEQDRRKS